MSEYERGYVQALRDMETHVRFVAKDRSASSEGRRELTEIAEFMARLIVTKEARLVALGGSGTRIGGG